MFILNPTLILHRTQNQVNLAVSTLDLRDLVLCSGDVDEIVPYKMYCPYSKYNSGQLSK